MAGKTHSPEARAKMAAAKRGNQHRLGKAHSEATRRCGKLHAWGGRQGIFVDHLDEDIHNNDLANLVPSCNMCNIHRRAA